MAYFPLFIDITGKSCAVIGGGKVAEGKIRQLLEFGGDVTVTAPEITEQIALWQQEGRIKVHLRVYEPGDIAEAALAVAATDDTALQRQVAELCRKKHIPVNVVDVKELCTFFFPAIVKREDVVAAVSTGGSSPALAARLRRELEEVIPESCGNVAGIMGAHRDYVFTHVIDGKQRKLVFEKMLDVVIDEGALSQEQVESIISEMIGRE